MPCIVDPYSNNFDEKEFDKMATECFGYFTLNDLSLSIAMASLCQWSQKQKADLERKMLSVKCYL